MDLIERQKAIDALDVLCQEHRYRIPGKRETYSEYNEAWQDALDRAEGAICNLPSAQPEPIKVSVDHEMTEEELKELKKKIADSPVVLLPSAQPEVKEIGYAECANAMLKMWIDNVLTDGEYNRVMDRLNAHYDAERRKDE